MKCRICKRDIPDNSIFCCWCGEKQLRERKKKDEIKVPKPRQLKSGKWNIELKAEGWSTTEDTPEECIIKAKAIRAGFLEAKKAAPKMTVDDAVKKYIDARRGVKSPSTIRGYETIRKNRFAEYMPKDINSVDWQAAIKKETAHCSAKTLKNAWGLVSSALAEAGVDPGEVSLPQIVKQDEPWLDYEQVLKFCDAVRGEPCELGALLALHSLRRSEIYALTADKIDLKQGTIHVEGAAVLDDENKLTQKDTNKNATSRRVVPIMIPRLKEILPAAMKRADGAPLMQGNINTLYNQINRVCRKADLPEVGVHGLRRSFASLAYHLKWSELDTMRVGGWSDFQTMRKIYTKLAEKDNIKSVKKMEKFYSTKKKNTNKNTNAT